MAAISTRNPRTGAHRQSLKIATRWVFEVPPGGPRTAGLRARFGDGPMYLRRRIGRFSWFAAADGRDGAPGSWKTRAGAERWFKRTFAEDIEKHGYTWARGGMRLVRRAVVVK